jgi:predicted transposase/invertase (TIGR01784 family)
MPLFNKKEHELETHFDKWLYFLKHLEDFDHIPAMLNEPIFQRGFEIAELAHLSSDEYDDYLKSVLQHGEAKAIEETAFAEGKMKGKIEGKIEAKIEVARTMLAEGLERHLIAKLTGLSQQEVDTL